jgi:hypothetical protein
VKVVWVGTRGNVFCMYPEGWQMDVDQNEVDQSKYLLEDGG